MTLAVMSEWSDMKSAIKTLTLATSAALLVASTSSTFDASGTQRVGSATSCRRPTDSKPLYHFHWCPVDTRWRLLGWGLPIRWADHGCAAHTRSFGEARKGEADLPSLLAGIGLSERIFAHRGLRTQ